MSQNRVGRALRNEYVRSHESERQPYGGISFNSLVRPVYVLDDFLEWIILSKHKTAHFEIVQEPSILSFLTVQFSIDMKKSVKVPITGKNLGQMWGMLANSW